MSAIYLVCAIILALVVPAKAQQLNHPKVIKLHNNATGEHLGTVTVAGNTAYYRNKDGEHYATGIRNPDGGMTFFDINGNVIKPIKVPE